MVRVSFFFHKHNLIFGVQSVAATLEIQNNSHDVIFENTEKYYCFKFWNC